MVRLDLPEDLLGNSEAAYIEAFLSGLRPDRLLKVWEWADAHRILPGRGSAEPGPYRTSRTPYLREPMEKLSRDDPTELVVVEKGSQIGASTVGENWCGQIMTTGGGPTLCVMPTDRAAQKMSKQRLQPMIDSSPVFRGKVAESKARDSGNTILEKEFIGGVLVWTGANSPVGLRTMAAKNVWMSEIDAYPPDVGGEGDVFELVMARTATFRRNRKILIESSPTIKHFSRIDELYQRTNQKRYFMPCERCGAMQYITWGHVFLPDPDSDEAFIRCEHCDGLTPEYRKGWMLENGVWKATAESQLPKSEGYHIPSLLVPVGWSPTFGEIRRRLRQARQDGPAKLKVIVNTVFGEAFEEDGDGYDHELLQKRLEPYDAEVPEGVLCLTAGVDFQKSPGRLECEVVGWGHGYESWGIDYLVHYCDVEADQVRRDGVEMPQSAWEFLDALWERKFRAADGTDLHVAAACLDTGWAAQRIYDYVRTRQSRRIYAVKGDDGSGRPYVTWPTKRKTGKNPIPVNLFVLGVDSLKGLHYSRLRLLERGAGFCHWPEQHERYTPQYFEGVTAEKLVTRYTRGISKQTWVKIRGYNEPLDARVYATAAAIILNPDFEVLDRRRSAEAEERPVLPVERNEARPRSNFVNRYKRR